VVRSPPRNKILWFENAHPGLSYCAAQVRDHDPDRYLATLFAPAEAREELFVLYAFDHEIGRVRRVVSEPMAGLVRLQWWRDALDAVATRRPPAHPVVEALHARWIRFAQLQSRLHVAIDARDQELSADPPADLAALEERLGSSWGEITLGALDLLGVADEPARAAARHLGLALGLVRLLQTLPGDLGPNRMPLPDTMLARHGLERERLQQEETAAALRPIVADLAGRAREHLKAARRHRYAVPKRALAALLPAPLLDAYLRRLARAGFDPLARVRTAPHGLAPLWLLGRHALGR
jgi:NADH dehydrogenase [ubiquinone] 1 alpha subcomplex assembly factor 6